MNDNTSFLIRLSSNDNLFQLYLMNAKLLILYIRIFDYIQIGHQQIINSRMSGVIKRHKQDKTRRALRLVLIFITLKLFQFAYECYSFLEEILQTYLTHQNENPINLCNVLDMRHSIASIFNNKINFDMYNMNKSIKCLIQIYSM